MNNIETVSVLLPDSESQSINQSIRDFFFFFWDNINIIFIDIVLRLCLRFLFFLVLSCLAKTKQNQTNKKYPKLRSVFRCLLFVLLPGCVSLSLVFVPLVFLAPKKTPICNQVVNRLAFAFLRAFFFSI